MQTQNHLLLLGAILISTATLAETAPPDPQVKQDSLYAVWQDNSQADSSRVKAYYSYIRDGFLRSTPDSAFSLAEGLAAFGREKHYPKAEALAYRLQGSSLRDKGDYPKALENFERSLKVYQEIDDPKGISSLLIEIGNTYYYQGDYSQAVKAYQRCLKVAQEIGNKQNIAGLTINIGVISMEQDNLPQALEYFQRALKIVEETGDKGGISLAQTNIGNIYLRLHDYPQALDYYQRGLKLKEDAGDKEGMALAISNIGSVYSNQGNYPEALEYCQRSLKIYEEIGERRNLVMPLWSIGDMYLKQAKYPEALDYFQRSLKVAEEFADKRGTLFAIGSIGWVNKEKKEYALAINPCQKALDLAIEIGSVTSQKDAYICLYQSNKALGNTREALKYHEKLAEMNDSLFNAEKTKKITQLEMQYDFDKKETATQAEQEKKDALAAEDMRREKLVRNGFMGGFAVVLLFAGVFFTQRNRIGKEKARSEELLLNILPEEVAEELKAKGSAEAVQIDRVTVLFTDFKGFTAMAEQMSPKELVQDLNICFSEFDRIMEKHGIEKIKTIGDAYMAAGGLPTPNTTHASDVIQAAFEMRDFVEAGKARKIAAQLPYFEIRIGVNTGPVVAGIVGVKKFQYDIWGDTVNTASRMESSGAVGQVNISEATYALVKDEAGLSFTPRGKVVAKGKGEMEMYFVERLVS